MCARSLSCQSCFVLSSRKGCRTVGAGAKGCRPGAGARSWARDAAGGLEWLEPGPGPGVEARGWGQELGPGAGARSSGQGLGQGAGARGWSRKGCIRQRHLETKNLADNITHRFEDITPESLMEFQKKKGAGSTKPVVDALNYALKAKGQEHQQAFSKLKGIERFRHMHRYLIDQASAGIEYTGEHSLSTSHKEAAVWQCIEPTKPKKRLQESLTTTAVRI